MKTIVWLVLATAPMPVYAQALDRPVRRIEVTVGGGLFGGADLGAADANLRANDTQLRPFRLFGTDSRFDGAPSLQISAGYPVTRRIGLEGGMLVSRPELRTTTTADVEGTPSVAIVEQIDQYLFDASVVVMIDELRIGSRALPFATAGGGYLRQLHEGLTVVEHGRAYYMGGGLKYWIAARPRGLIRATGLRADTRVYFLARGIVVDDSPRPRVAISGSFFVSF